MRILFLIVCLMSFSAKADMNTLCLLGFYEYDDREIIFKECERNNIVEATFSDDISLSGFVAAYCRFDRNTVVIQDSLNKNRKHLSCVLYNNKPRRVYFD